MNYLIKIDELQGIFDQIKTGKIMIDKACELVTEKVKQNQKDSPCDECIKAI